MQDERGIALAVAIFALVIVGALVAGAFFAGTQEQRVAESSRRLQQSFGLAEIGVGQQVASWNPNVNNVLTVFPTQERTVAGNSQTGAYGGSIRKLNANLYLIDITAQDSISFRSGLRSSSGGARQRVGLLARIKPLQMDIQASLTTQGDVVLRGTSKVDGTDQLPPGWTDCDPAGAPAAGIRLDEGTVTVQGAATVAGIPPVRNDTAVNPSTFTQYGDVGYADLAARATLTLPGGNYQTKPTLNGLGACNKADLTNWGDGMNHASPCATYFPIIHITGSVTLNGVQGQGILMVDGDLTVQGSYQFFGITIVRGSLSTAGGGATDAHFWGTVMAQNVNLELQGVSGKATLSYSKCAIIQAFQMTGTVVPMVSRGWAQLF
jgi:hypothetical protein